MSHRVFVGKIAPDSVTEADLKDVFSKYGEVMKIDVKPTYAFVFYDNPEECEAAIQYMDGQNVNGNIIIVQSARGTPRDNKAKQTRRNDDLRLTVIGLDHRTSWQDLKDWAREAGDVTFANVFNRDNKTVGVIEYTSAEALNNALLVLPDSLLKGAKVQVYKEQDIANKYETGRNDEWGNQGFQHAYVNSRGGECMTIMNLEIVILLEEEVAVVVEDTVEAHLTLEVVIMTGEIIEDMMVHMDMVTIPEDPQDRQFISLITEGSVFRVAIIAVQIAPVLDPEREVVVIHKGAMDMTIEVVAIIVVTLLMAVEEAMVIVEDHHRADFTMDLLCQNHVGVEQDMILDVERTVNMILRDFQI
eukprot:gene23998-32403_t